MGSTSGYALRAVDDHVGSSRSNGITGMSGPDARRAWASRADSVSTIRTDALERVHCSSSTEDRVLVDTMTEQSDWIENKAKRYAGRSILATHHKQPIRLRNGRKG